VTGRGRYGEILRTPHVAALVATSIFARLPDGMLGLAVILYLSDARDSFAVAGLVAGAFGLGAAAGAPVQSRLIDRIGQARVLSGAAVIDAVAIVGLVGLTEADASTAVLVVVGLIGGLAVPNVSSALRALWPGLLRGRDELVTAAFALDSVALELLFSTGPLITALIVVVVSPAAAVIAGGLVVLLGTLAFVAQPPSRAWRPDAAAGSQGMLGALRAPGVRLLMIATLPLGFGFGALEIALPAFASAEGSPASGGILLAVWALGSAAGGLLYGARTWGGSLPRTYRILAALMPLGFLPATLATSIPLMAVLVIPAGLAIAPVLAAGNQLAGEAAPPGALTEAFTWPVTALIGGFALGQAAGGALVEASGWRASVLAAAAAAALCAAAAWLGRSALERSVTAVP